ncbi:MAG: cytochrome D1 domain-containing protein [Betaproteobacteria bacterium]
MFALLVASPAGGTPGATGIPAARADAADFVVTLSAACNLSTIGLPHGQTMARFDGGECDEHAVARSADRRSLYVGGRSGRIEAMSLPGLVTDGRRYDAGRAIRQLLATSDGRYLVVVIDSDGAASSMVVLHGESLAPARIVALRDRRGQAMAIARLTEVAHRRSVLVTFEQSNEFWELFLAADAEPVFEGLVHDYRLGEGISEPRNLPIRRMVSDAPMQHFLIESHGAHLSQLVVSSAGSAVARRFNLDVRQQVGESTMPAGMVLADTTGVATERASYWLAAGRGWPGIHVIDLADMKEHGFVDLPGERCRVMSSPAPRSSVMAACGNDMTDQLFIVDLVTRQVRALLQPMAGRRISKVAVSAAARYLVVALTGGAGDLALYGEDCRCRVREFAVAQLRRIVD